MVTKGIAIDVGFGFTKFVSDDGRRGSFPSVAVRSKGRGDLAAALGASTPRHRLELELMNGERQAWLIGDAALATGGTRSWNTAASERLDYDVLTLAGLWLAGAEGRVRIVAGLPLSVWLDRGERKALRRRLEGLSAWVSVDGGDARYVEIQSVTVLPQSLGAALAALDAPGGDRLEGRDIAVVDIGYRTTDMLLLLGSPDGVAIPDEERSGSVDVGIGQAYAEVSAELARETGGMVPQGLVERALLAQDGILAVRGRDRDLRPSFERACAALAAEVEAHVRRAWKDRLDFLAAIVVAGGGGAILASHLKLPAVMVSPDAPFANAVGFLSALAEDASTRV